MRHPHLVSLVAATLLFTAACQKDGSAEPAPATKAALADDDGAAEVALPPGSGPVALVDGTAIPRAAFEAEYVATIQRYRNAKQTVSPGLQERLKDQIVRRLVDAELVRKKADVLGVELTPEEREHRWNLHRSRFGSDAAFAVYLERTGTTEAEARRRFDEDLLREKVFATVAEGVEVSDADKRAFYEAHLDRYTKPEQIRARHILIRKPEDADAAATRELKAKAEQIRRRARAGKVSFEELAEKASEDPGSKTRGGDLGWFPRGRMVKPFDEAVWSLDKGEISEVVETTFGFHVIQKTDERKAKVLPFEEVEPSIDKSLRARRQGEAVDQSLDRWREEADIEIFVAGDPELMKAETTPRPDAPAEPPSKGRGLPERLPKPISTKPPIEMPAPGERTGPLPPKM